MLTSREVAELAVKTLDAKKGRNIRLLRTGDVTIISDYFVICTAGSTSQLKTLADELSYVLEENGETTLRCEGTRECGWMLVDFPQSGSRYLDCRWVLRNCKTEESASA